MTSASGLVWSMNCESWEEPKNSLTAAMTGFALTRSRGHRVVDVLVDRHPLLDRTLHPHAADAELVLEELSDARTRRLARESMSSMPPKAARQLQEVADDRDEVLLVEDSLRGLFFRPSLTLNLKRPTSDRSYLRSSKKRPSNSVVADSSVGGSPGRRRR